MKQTAIFFIGLIMSFGADAQTWGEWFKQKKTQKKYLIQQIAALKVYLKYLKEGYDIARKGMTIVGDIKDENYDDHSTYFGSLKLVNNAVGSSSKIQLTIAYQQAIMKELSELNKDCRDNGMLTQQEMEYVSIVYNHMLTECEKSIDALNTVVTNNASQMTDDERIERIGSIYEDMKDKYAFTRSFCDASSILVMQRTVEQNEIVAQRKLNTAL